MMMNSAVDFDRFLFSLVVTDRHRSAFYGGCMIKFIRGRQTLTFWADVINTVQKL